MGDRTQERVSWGMRCELCGRKAYLAVDFHLLGGRERAVTPVRTLVKIRTIKRPIWRDEPA
ncbi:hypothetical protein [Chelativorans sp. M5D2P16]|uniref:hypothetical protein n=1 Tax=Chelativorans sp. M5D2P16 TaxID=3095678 RepID=UPI002ACA820E|nr:hypothetical protein [Chelativorans sp. M5D2P16]MDZ5697835.1 hypothetical protein [Chelativorans sp. M5D2P16]